MNSKTFKMKPKVIHFAPVERATESDNNEYWYPTACGLDSDRIILSDNPKEITCKNCLKQHFLNKK